MRIPKDRLAITAVQQYLKCGEQWRLRQELGPIPPGAAQIQGRGVHKGAEVNLKQKARTRIDLTIAEVEAAVSDEIEANFHGEVMLTDDERGQGLAAVKGATKDRAVTLGRMHREVLAPAIQPIYFDAGAGQMKEGVELWVTADLKKQIGVDLTGVLDLKEEDGSVRDLKTVGKRPFPDAAELSGQITMYAMLDSVYAKQTGLPRAPDFYLDHLIMTRAGVPSLEIQRTQRDRTDMLAMLDRVKQVRDGIEKEIFLPTNPDNWWCSARWCGYHQAGACKYVKKGARRPLS